MTLLLPVHFSCKMTRHESRSVKDKTVVLKIVFALSVLEFTLCKQHGTAEQCKHSSCRLLNGNNQVFTFGADRWRLRSTLSWRALWSWGSSPRSVLRFIRVRKIGIGFVNVLCLPSPQACFQDVFLTAPVSSCASIHWAIMAGVQYSIPTLNFGSRFCFNLVWFVLRTCLCMCI
jgi:hypothetical protein